MRIDCVVCGMFAVNCYVLHYNNEVIIIDPGKNATKIAKYVEDTEKVVAIVLTHGHFDHIGAVDDLVDLYHCPVYLNKEDHILLNHEQNSMSGIKVKIKNKPLNLKEGKMKISQFELMIYHVPGHTPGCCLIIWQNNMFSGDFLFKQSIGRTDLFLSNDSLMKQSLKLLLEFKQDYIVYPGHGPSSTLFEEIENNYFLK